jgi:hypothetical protein
VHSCLQVLGPQPAEVHCGWQPCQAELHCGLQAHLPAQVSQQVSRQQPNNTITLQQHNHPSTLCVRSSSQQHCCGTIILLHCVFTAVQYQYQWYNMLVCASAQDMCMSAWMRKCVMCSIGQGSWGRSWSCSCYGGGCNRLKNTWCGWVYVWEGV